MKAIPPSQLLRFPPTMKADTANNEVYRVSQYHVFAVATKEQTSQLHSSQSRMHAPPSSLALNLVVLQLSSTANRIFRRKSDVRIKGKSWWGGGGRSVC